MVLLLQLNGELPERFPGHERRIYVFGCRKPTCRRKEGSIRVLRGVRVWEEEETAEPMEEDKKEEVKKEESVKSESKGPGLGETLFGAKSWGDSSSSAAANPFSSGGGNPFSAGGSSSANPFSSSAQKEASPPQNPWKPKATEESTASLTKTFAQTLSLDLPPGDNQPPPPAAEPWPESDARPKPYPTLYLCDADYETIDPRPAEKLPANARIVEADDTEEPSAADREAFESTMDRTFQRFADRLAQNPEQVIRYEFGGQPLLYSKTDAVAQTVTSRGGMPGCANCRGRRTFEVQMTPHAIAELEQDEMGFDGMEWGTIIVGVCVRDCVPQGTPLGEVVYVEEWAGVQWEELVTEKKK
jgi:pre-rRNA-processing protein TSR4